MLAASHCVKDYVADCRARMAAQVSAFRALVAAATAPTHEGDPKPEAAARALEPHVFGSMLLAREGHFVHRTRALELKDGSALNEVRMHRPLDAFTSAAWR